MKCKKKLLLWAAVFIAAAIAAAAVFFGVMTSPVNADKFETLELEDGTLYIDDYNGLPRFDFVFPSQIGGKKVTEIGSCFTFAKGKEFIRTAEIPEGVTRIMGTFDDLDRLESVKLPDSLKVVGYSSFSGCEGLTEISLPDGLEEIGHTAFEGCTSLERVDIPESVKLVDNVAFINCTSLRYASIPENARVGSKVFADCASLEEVILPENAVYGDMVFRNTPFEAKEAYFILNGSLQRANADGTAVIPDNVSRIGELAFSESNITKVIIPESVTGIGEYAFLKSNVTEVIIPESVTEIGTGAFRDCSLLESAAFPEGISAIPDRCFSNCTSMTQFSFPDSVTEIGSMAFSGSGLTAVGLSDNIGVIGDGAFSACQNIVSLTYPADITVGGGAFSNLPSLTELSFEEGVSELPQGCFMNCTALAEIRLPDSIRSIGMGCFQGCTGLEYAELCISRDGYGDNMDYMAEEYTYRWFADCDKLEYVFLSDKTEIADYRSLMAGTRLKGIYVPESVIGYSSGSRNTNTEYYKENPVTVYSENDTDVINALTYMSGAVYSPVSSREEAERLMGIGT